MSKLTQEYGNTEAGKALEAKGFSAKSVGGAVVFRLQRFGVTVDVLDALTGMAPRETTNAVEVRVSTDGPADDALVMNFGTLSDFLATLT